MLLNPAIPNGFEICRSIKNDPENRKTMVLMISDLNSLGDIERAIEAGTDDFISKPLEKADLLKRVRNLLALRQAIDDARGVR